MRKKTVYLYAVISAPLCGAMLQIVAGDRLFSLWDLPVALLSLLFVFAWYRIDTEERHLRRRIWGNCAITCMTFIAMPVYLIKTRGWLKGIGASLLFVVITILWDLLSGLGALITEWLFIGSF